MFPTLWSNQRSERTLTCFHSEYQMILEKAPHRIKEPLAYWLESKVALGKRHDGFREDHPARNSCASTFARPTNLVTAAQAGVLLGLSSLPTLLRSKFQTTGMLDDSAQVPMPGGWRALTSIWGPMASFSHTLQT